MKRVDSKYAANNYKQFRKQIYYGVELIDDDESQS